MSTAAKTLASLLLIAISAQIPTLSACAQSIDQKNSESAGPKNNPGDQNRSKKTSDEDEEPTEQFSVMTNTAVTKNSNPDLNIRKKPHAYTLWEPMKFAYTDTEQPEEKEILKPLESKKLKPFKNMNAIAVLYAHYINGNSKITAFIPFTSECYKSSQTHVTPVYSCTMEIYRSGSSNKNDMENQNLWKERLNFCYIHNTEQQGNIIDSPAYNAVYSRYDPNYNIIQIHVVIQGKLSRECKYDYTIPEFNSSTDDGNYQSDISIVN